MLFVCYLFVVWYLFDASFVWRRLLSSGSDHRPMGAVLLLPGCHKKRGRPRRDRTGGAVELTPFSQSGYWRVEIAWLDATPRYFGKFQSQSEAEKWIEQHRWLTEQTQEPSGVLSDVSSRKRWRLQSC